MAASPEGNLVVISGPSGVGKSTIIDAVMQHTPAVFSVSATTRSPRAGEVEGIDYHFVDRDSFLEAIDDGQVLEWAEYGGNLYGTLRSEVDAAIAQGATVILDIENDGARQVREAFDGAVLIFIMPPSIAELEQRLAARGDTSPADMAKRLSVASQQIAEAPGLYDYVVENRTLGAAIGQVLDILDALALQRASAMSPTTLATYEEKPDHDGRTANRSPCREDG